MTDEKRKKARKQVETPIAVSNLHNQAHIGYLVNIAKEGCMIISDFPIDQNQVFQIQIRFADDITIELGADSLWCEATLDKNKFWTGFQIIDISPAHQEILNRFVHNLA